MTVDRKLQMSSDIHAVERCLAGDNTGFERLVSKYHNPIFKAVYRIVGNIEDAREVAQIAFVKAFRSLKRFDDNYRFFSWIYRIARNESINYVQRRRLPIELNEDLSTSDPTPEQLARVNELEMGIQQALGRLKPEYRALIVLRHVTGCSYQDLTRILNLPETKIKSRLFMARCELRRDLQRQGLI